MAISSDLAGVFQIILAQQEAEARKERDQQQTALTLLSMEMRETEGARNILLKEYYDKKEEVATTEKMFDKYRAMDPDYKSSGGMDLVNIVDKENKVDMSAVTQNLDALTTYQGELQSELTNLESQASVFREIKNKFVGENRTLQPHEYYADPSDDVEQMQEYVTKPVSEGGLGWETTAGMDLLYKAEDPEKIADLAEQRGLKREGEAKTGATASYGMIQSTIRPEGEDPLKPKHLTYIDQDQASPTYGQEKKPSEAVVNELKSMLTQPSYDNFVSNFYALESIQPETAAEIRKLLEGNPLLAKNFANLEEDYNVIQSLERELAGINLPKLEDPEDTYAAFVEDLEGVTDPATLFGAFKEMDESGIVAKKERGKFFDFIEDRLGVADAYPAYKVFLDPSLDTGFGKYQQAADILQQEFKIQETTKRSFNEARQDLAGELYGARYWGRPGSGYDMPYDIEELNVEVENRIRALTAKGKGDEVRAIISAYDSYKEVQTELEGLYK